MERGPSTPDRDGVAEVGSVDGDARADGGGGLADADARDALLAASGRLAWLEAVRRESRSVRHDLANVLTGISFYSSELAGSIPDGSQATRDAAAIGEEVARGTRLLERLLVLWREPSEAQVVPLDPAAVVDALAPLLTVVAAPAELLVGPLESLVVRASRRALEEALLVLVLEGRGPGGRIRVAVEAEVVDGGRGQAASRVAAIRVTRDGAGAASRLSSAATDLRGSGGGTDGPSGLALASAAAGAVGGTVREERLSDGGLTTIMLLPEAVSRQRRRSIGEGAAGHG